MNATRNLQFIRHILCGKQRVAVLDRSYLTIITRMIFSLALIKPSLYIIGPTERTEPLAKVLSPGGRHIHLHKSFVLLSARGQVRTTSSSPGRPLGGSKGPLSRRRRGPRTTYSKKWAKFFWTIIHLPPTPPGLPIFFKKRNYRHTLKFIFANFVRFLKQ